MGKSNVPRGATRKEPCTKCGILFYHYLISSGKIITECQVCKPQVQDKKK